jgi:hypothetical protein
MASTQYQRIRQLVLAGALGPGTHYAQWINISTVWGKLGAQRSIRKGLDPKDMRMRQHIAKDGGKGDVSGIGSDP